MTQSDSKPSLFWFFNYLANALAILSVAALLKHGVDMGDLWAPVQLTLEYYEWVVQKLIGWAEPYLQSIVVFVISFLSLDVRLEREWRHIFILMMLFFGALARDMLARQHDKVAQESLLRATRAWAIGILVSLITSVGLSLSGKGPQDDPSSALWNGVRATIPLAIVGVIFLAYGASYTKNLAKTRGVSWSRFVLFEVRGVAVLLFLAAVVAISAGLWIVGSFGNFPSEVLFLLPLLTLPRPLIVLLGFFLVGLFFVVWGALNAWGYAKRRDTDWKREFWNSTWTRVGVSILTVLFGAALFLIVGAGGKLI